MKFRRSHQFLCDAPSAVALAGVMFMLLFYLLSNSALLLTEGASLVRLPEGGSGMPKGFSHSTMVAMDHQARLYFRNQQIELPELEKQLGQLAKQAWKSGLLLVLKADKSVSYEKITRLADAAQAVGVRQTWLAARPRLFE
mgnify:FL=1